MVGTTRLGTLTLAMNNTLQRMQTLVGAAGEALGIVEDPLTTLVGSKVTKGNFAEEQN